MTKIDDWNNEWRILLIGVGRVVGGDAVDTTIGLSLCLDRSTSRQTEPGTAAGGPQRSPACAPGSIRQNASRQLRPYAGAPADP